MSGVQQQSQSFEESKEACQKDRKENNNKSGKEEKVTHSSHPKTLPIKSKYSGQGAEKRSINGQELTHVQILFQNEQVGNNVHILA